MQEKVTIYDIAKIAGVSPSTVSRTANNQPGVKKATRARITKLLEEYSYTPNETARSLVTQSSRMVGVLISDIRMTHHTDGIFYLQRELSKRGYACLIYNTGTDEAEQAQYIQLMEQRKVEAAVLMGSIYQSEGIKRSIKKYLSSIPVFICNGYLDLPNVYGLIADECGGVRDCVKLLADKGRRKLAFIVDHYTPSNILKRQGFEEGLAKYLPEAEPIVIESGMGTGEIYATTQRLMAEHPEVGGIIFSEDLLAIIGIRALKEMDLRVPEDVAVIGINNSRYTEACTPTLTSLDTMLYDLSLTMARDIFSVLEGEHINRRVMIYSKIVERAST